MFSSLLTDVFSYTIVTIAVICTNLCVQYSKLQVVLWIMSCMIEVL